MPNASKLIHSFYTGAAWRKLRKAKLTIDPCCEYCQEAGNVTGAVEVHHVLTVGQHWQHRLDFNNLKSLCKACHSRETLKQSKSKEFKPYKLKYKLN